MYCQPILTFAPPVYAIICSALPGGSRFVQSCDDKPKRRLFELLKGQGIQLNQQIVFLSDGGDTVRNLQLYLNPEAEHLLDWFHIAMRLTMLRQIAKGLPMTVGDGDEKCELREPALKVLEGTQWYLWHGNTYEALQHLETLEMDLDGEDEESRDSTTHKLLRAVEEFQTYIANNQAFIPNYGERYRQGDRISTGFVESTVNYASSPSALQSGNKCSGVRREPILFCKRGRGC